MPEKTMPFVRAAADLVNLSVSLLVTAVFQIERRLQVWDTEQRKKDKGKQKMSLAGAESSAEPEPLDLDSATAMDID